MIAFACRGREREVRFTDGGVGVEVEGEGRSGDRLDLVQVLRVVPVEPESRPLLDSVSVSKDTFMGVDRCRG